MVAAAIRTIFAQPGPQHVAEQFDTIATMLGRQFSKVEQMLRDAEADVTAFAASPISHWKKIWSTNPLERLNKEIKRRTDVVGVPQPARATAPGRRGPGRSPRRMAGRRQSLPVRRLDGHTCHPRSRHKGGSRPALLTA